MGGRLWAVRSTSSAGTWRRALSTHHVTVSVLSCLQSAAGSMAEAAQVLIGEVWEVVDNSYLDARRCGCRRSMESVWAMGAELVWKAVRLEYDSACLCLWVSLRVEESGLASGGSIWAGAAGASCRAHHTHAPPHA
jgi:hypothetical protein